MSTISSTGSDRAYIKSAQETEDSYRERLKSQKEDHESEKRIMEESRAEERRRLQEDYQREIKKGHQESADLVELEKRRARDEVSKLQAQIYDKQGGKFAKDSRDLSDERRDLAKFRNDMIQDLNKQREKQANTNYDVVEKLRKDFGTKTEEALRAQRRGMEGEMNRQNLELAYHRAHESRRANEIADARAKTVHDVEHENVWKTKQLQEGFEKEQDRLKYQVQKAGDYHDQRMQEVAAENSERLTNSLLKQRNEFAARERELNRENSRIVTEFNKNLKFEQDRNDRRSEQMHSKGESDRSAALNSQKENFIRDQKQKDIFYTAEIAERDRKINRLQSPKDAGDVPLAARERIEEGVINQFQKKLDLVEEKRELERRQILDKIAEERIDTQLNNEKTLRKVTRDATAAVDEERNKLIGAYLDLQVSKEEEKKRTEFSHQRQLEMMNKSHSKELEKQTSTIRESVDNFRFQQQNRTRHAQEDAQFKIRQKDRERQIELGSQRREAEKKMLEMREDYEMQINELKAEKDVAVREAQRKGREQVDERVREYEFKIAQMEQSFKERERFLTEHFEDELDRVKRTNARLIQKKS